MSIKLMLSFSNLIFSEGVKRLLDNEKDLQIIEIGNPEAEYTIEKLKTINPDIILTDFITLYNSFPGIENTNKKFQFILFDTNLGRDNLVSTILKKKINGVLLCNANSGLLAKAIRAVHKGELWIDKQTFKNLLNGINALSSDKVALLSAREKEIVQLTGEGFRNKEIASKLNLSEPTVKTHLSRIFQKLSIKTRAELISYAIKHNDLNHTLIRTTP